MPRAKGQILMQHCVQRLIRIDLQIVTTGHQNLTAHAVYMSLQPLWILRSQVIKVEFQPLPCFHILEANCGPCWIALFFRCQQMQQQQQ